MAIAPPMNTNWGIDQIGDNLFNASLTAWKATPGGIGADLAFGFIPVMLAVIIFVRFKEILPALFAMGLTTAVLHELGALSYVATNMMYLITVIGLTVNFMIWLKNK